MNCPGCRQPYPAGFAFCPHCGTALDTSSTGALAPAALLQRALHEQGGSRDQGVTFHNRRMITILFCDVVDSTALAEQLDPEDYLEIMNGAFDALTPSIVRHEGMVARLVGDAALAFFGASTAHEDDPERAVRAGLEMVEQVARYREHLAQERGIEGFAVRVGINTGLVVVGAVGSDERAEYTAMGEAVNLAARMQTAAPPGGVLITQDTYRQVRGRFDFVPQPLMRVKGHSEPLQTYLVVRAKPLAFPVRNRGIEGVTTPMVGRDAEMATLQNAYLDASEGGQARIVTVLGEAGLGKSRLLDEFTAWVDLRPEYQYYWRGRATRSTQATPYALLRDLFARRFRIQDSDSAADALARFRQALSGILAPEQADLAGHLAGFDFSASPAVRGLLGSPAFRQIAAGALRQALQTLWGLGRDGAPVGDQTLQAGQEGPVVVLLEDLHWADDASLDLIASLTGEDGQARLLMVAAARPDFLQRRPNWGEGQETHLRLELRPLSRRSSRALAGEILRRVPQVPRHLVERLVDGADGNPFFLEELVKVLIEDGAIETGVDEWRINPEKLRDARLPPTLTAVLQARLDALPAAERLVLQRASVIGKQFWDTLVADLVPEVPDVAPPLAALRSRELIYRRERSAFAGATEYTFEHAILREVTYESVLLHVRRECHAQVARWLEARAGERLNEYLAQIAGHYHQAGQDRVAAAWYIRAGEHAANLGANGEARELFEIGLRLLPAGDLEQRWRALAGHDEVLGVLGESDARQVDDDALLALAWEMDDDNKVAEAQFRRGHYLAVLSRYGEAMEALDLALAAAGRAGNLKVRANALSVKLSNLPRMGRMAEAAAIVGEALACADRLGQPMTLARTLSNISIYYAAEGDLVQAAQLMARQAGVMREMGNLFGEGLGLGNLGYYYLLLGDYAKARATLEDALALTKRIGARRERLYTQLNLALACGRTGDATTARELLEEILPELATLGDAFAAASGKNYLGLVLEQCAEAPAAAAAFQEAHDLLAAIGARGPAMDALAGLVRCRMAKGLLDQVREGTDEIWSTLQQGLGGMEFPMLAYETCAAAFERLGETELGAAAARAGYLALVDQAAKIGDPEWRRSFMENIAEHRALVERIREIDPALRGKASRASFHPHPARTLRRACYGPATVSALRLPRRGRVDPGSGKPGHRNRRAGQLRAGDGHSGRHPGAEVHR